MVDIDRIGLITHVLNELHHNTVSYSFYSMKEKYNESPLRKTVFMDAGYGTLCDYTIRVQ